MPLIVVCPNCSAKMRAPDNAIGRQARCPGCKELVTITGPEGVTEPPEPEARSQPEPEPEERSRGVRTDRDESSPRRPRSRDRDDEEDDRPARRSRSRRDEDDEEDERPRRSRRRSNQEEPGLSIASLVLGCVSFLPCVCGGYGLPFVVVCGILAIVLGIIGQKKGGKGMALAGIILGSVALALAAIGVLAVIGLIGALSIGGIR